MDRRSFLAGAAGAGVALAATTPARAAKKPGTYYEVFGKGIPLVLGYPIMASETPEEPGNPVLKGYLERLTDRYKVLVMDYPDQGPGRGRSKPIEGDLTAQRVCDDLLAVADDAGFKEFIWWGFSWGGVIGLQLASRTSRVKALVCGGWPPLGGPYADLLRAVKLMDSNKPPESKMPTHQYVKFYESVQGWPEAEAVGRIKCPRLTYVGTTDIVDLGGVKVPLGPIIHEHRADLEKTGWQVAEIAGRDHSVFKDPATVVPIVRRFLDRVV